MLKKSEPYVNKQGDLVIPFDCDDKYKPYKGGQSYVKTLLELSATPEVMRKYNTKRKGGKKNG